MLLAGCTSDYGITKERIEAEPGITAPEIEVDPTSHDFGALAAGSEMQDTIINIKNIGNDDLNITDIQLHYGNSNFSLTTTPNGIVEPLQSTELIVAYEPGTYEINYDVISIFSNDADEPEILVYLDGSGDAPVIHITPTEYDFGTTYVGCEDALGVTITNIGNANLEIVDLEYFASLPVDFSIEDFETEHGPLPWTITPTYGDYIHLRIEYIPLDLLDDEAWVEVTSNDPATPIATAEHEGIGDYETWVLDSFTQDGEIAVDILFVIDNSGSMSGNQTNLKNNFDDFIAVFGVAGVDYHIALITTDDAAFVGSIITPADADPITEFNNQVDSIGNSGSAYEKGLWYSYVSTDTGGDAAPGSSTGFFRSAAKLVIVYVSDEPDFSHSTAGGGGSTAMGTADYTTHLLSLKSSTDLIAAHAVAGDYPSGCSTNGGAQFGDGYYDVVNDLGGAFMSICADDWSVTMDTLARDSMAIVSFPLSDIPIEDSIEVEVDGVASTDWTYSSSSNSVTFTIAPPEGSTIDIAYAVLANCD
jgi:hypothetical protein